MPTLLTNICPVLRTVPCGAPGASHRVLIARQTHLFQGGPFWVSFCILPGEEQVLTVPSD